ncbi:uncharacterized protein SCHCODRAFT_02573024 [Schizophyllum commune H4-8]|uniref:uncharacterized protein n=1 Tax=Schizophyllum commune (strain H4-8 / FGSC 9210) TaxID=578458 RepID=UPI00215F8787|nr:uncharacterized protein SCHCODRAFT_02573024 [Schizophyllum commune H4-8]KAI5895433.1 hypothetical protein SCHCODRAFT_02573024 [Schizophyllum commune H4-8]
MPDTPRDRNTDPADKEIANLYMSWLIKTHTADILEDLEQLTDVALTGQVDFARIASVLVTIDALNLTVPGKPHLLLAPLFAPLQLRYSQLLTRTRQIAAREVAYAERYVHVVLPILRDASYSNEEKKEVVQSLVTFLETVQRESDELHDEFDTLRRQLLDFADLLKKFALEVGVELGLKLREVQAEIDRVLREMEKMQRQLKDDKPSFENTSKTLLTMSAMAPAMAGAAGYEFAVIAAGKTLAGTATAVGSAGCVGALSAALPVAMVVLAGWGIWAAIKSAQVVADLARISALTAELVVHQLRLAELLRQSATLGAVEALAHNAILSVVTASTKVGNLVKVWSMVSQDAKAMLELLDSGASTEEIFNNALLAESWYGLLVSLLRNLSSKLLPRAETPTRAPIPSLQRLLEHFSCQGGTSHFLPQSRPMPPLASTVPSHELTIGDFVREFDDYLDGSTTINDEDLTEDQRALAEILTGMRHPQPFLFDAASGAALGDVGVATLTYGRIASSIGRFAKAGVLRAGMLRSGNISAFFGPRLTRLTGNADVRRELFKEILEAARDVPKLPPNPDHNAPATHENIVWLLMWRHRLFEWIVREGLYAPWRVWYHPLWSNPVLFEHMQDLLGQAADSIHRAFEEWCAKRRHKDGEDEDNKDGSSDDHNTHLFFVATPPAVAPKTDGTAIFNVDDAESDLLDDDHVSKLANNADSLDVGSPATLNKWQEPFKVELAKWLSQKLAAVVSTWLTDGDEAHFWQDFGRAVYEDKFELIDQIYRLNLLQLGLLTADTRLSLDGNLFYELVRRMDSIYAQAVQQGYDHRIASAALYFYAARCPTYGRLVLALALQNALVKVYGNKRT